MHKPLPSPPMPKSLKYSQTGYDLGMRSMVDTLLAQRQYYAARRDWLNAHFDYLVAYVDLQKATGRLGDDTVKTLDNLLQASVQPRPLSD
ncbi:TolC family protein [Faucicola atlantae]|uniref:TolC family protein n=1 Tax=Faucicola atlantae TaxID=34059 RepID=UPI0025B1471D|nr:TolC family protein [Moraxella atlantae]